MPPGGLTVPLQLAPSVSGARQVTASLVPIDRAPLLRDLRPGDLLVTSYAVATLDSEALRAIQYGEVDAMICGGAEATITPIGIAGFSAMFALSRRNDEPTR